MNVIRGFRRLELDFDPGQRHAAGQLLPGGGQLRDRPDRGEGRPAGPAGAARAPRRQGHGRPRPARRGARPRDRREDRRRRARGLLARARRSSSRRASSSRRSPRPDLAGARASAERALSAPVTLVARRRGGSCSPRASSRRCSSSRPATAGASSSAARPPTRTSRSSTASSAARLGAHFAATGDQVSVVPAAAGARSRRPDLGGGRARRGRVADRPGRPPRRDEGHRRQDDRGGSGDGDHRRRLELRDGLRRRSRTGSTTSSSSRTSLNGKLIAPGATFSFNQATGSPDGRQGLPRGARDHQRRARRPGSAAVSARSRRRSSTPPSRPGLPITARTNHALYISHYPLGRDATVDYPDIDLKFVNDTGHWLLLRTFVGPSSLVVTLYGTPQHRRIVTNTAPLVQTAPMPIERTLDRALAPGNERDRVVRRARVLDLRPAARLRRPTASCSRT